MANCELEELGKGGGGEGEEVVTARELFPVDPNRVKWC